MSTEHKATAAIATLERLGYTHNGGYFWKPPLGKVPDFDLVDHWRAKAEVLRAQVEALTKPPVIELDFKQAHELLQMFADEPGLVTLMMGDGHSGSGLYAGWSEVPEEGAIYLGQADDEAAAQAESAKPVEWQARPAEAQEWRRIDPTREHPTVELRADYLRAFKNADGSNAYVVRALYTAPQPNGQ